MMPPQQTETFQMREKETTNRREIRSPIKKKKNNKHQILWVINRYRSYWSYRDTGASTLADRWSKRRRYSTIPTAGHSVMCTAPQSRNTTAGSLDGGGRHRDCRMRPLPCRRWGLGHGPGRGNGCRVCRGHGLHAWYELRSTWRRMEFPPTGTRSRSSVGGGQTDYSRQLSHWLTTRGNCLQ
jgi:hypothetical protein